MRKQKWILRGVVVLCLLLCIAATSVKSNKRFLSERGPRVAGTINTAITAVGTKRSHFVIDAGEWDIGTNVTFPSNVTVEIAHGSFLNIRTGIVVRCETNAWLCGPWQAFSGLGTATGLATFIYRYPEWGDEAQYDIGDGVLPNAVSNLYVENGGPIVTTNSSFTMAPGTTGTFSHIVAGTGTFYELNVTNLNASTGIFETAHVENLFATNLTVGGVIMTPATNSTFIFATNDTLAARQAVIDAVPKFIPPDVTVTFRFEDGTHTLTNRLNWLDFRGDGGEILIVGNPGEATTIHTNQAAVINGSGDVSILFIENCGTRIRIEKLKITHETDTVNTTGILVDNAVGLLRGCFVQGNSTTTGNNIRIDRGEFDVNGCVVSNARGGITANDGGMVAAESNGTEGETLPKYGYIGASAGVLGYNSSVTNPPGSTANTLEAAGGQVAGSAPIP